MRRLLRDTRGGTGLLVGAAMPILIGMAAFAVDMGAAQLDSRKLQGLADSVALAAAADPDHAEERANALVRAAGWPRPLTVRVTTGRYARDPAVPVDQRFATGDTQPDAIRIQLDGTTPTYLAAIFGQRDIAVTRVATAQRQQFAAFSIGSRLASLDGGLLNAYLSALTGSSLSLSVLDYRALASADVDLFGYLDALKTSARLDAATYDDVLCSQIATGQALDALAATLASGGNASAATAVRALAANAGNGSLSLRALIDAGPYARRNEGAAGVARVDGLAVATALLQLAAQRRQASFDLGSSIPGIAATQVTLAIGDRAQQSPWIAVTAAGTPIVRTAQVRLYVRARLAPAALPGIGGLTTIEVPIFVELAAAEGRLRSIDCATGTTRGVTLEAHTDAGSAALGTVDASRLDDFGTPITPATATLVDTPLVDVLGSSRVSLGAAEPWQSLRFGDAAIAAGTRQTVRGSVPVSGIATSLAAQPQLSVRVLGLPIPLDPLLRSVGGTLITIAPALDTLIMAATGTLGVGIGEADLRVTGMRCGQAVLVA